MSARLRAASLVGLIGVALGVSAVLYSRSKGADLDGHARVIGAVGTVRHLDRLLAEEVLASRFGLLNQYDSITATELALKGAEAELRARMTHVVPAGGPLDESLVALGASLAQQRLAVERFKSANAVLKNSLHYLPTAAEEVTRGLDKVPDPSSATGGRGRRGRASPPVVKASRNESREIATAVHGVVRAALAYDVIGDRSSRAAHDEAVARLVALAQGSHEKDGGQRGVETVLAHAGIIGDRQPAVDRLLHDVVESDVSARIDAVEGTYQTRFGETVMAANRYRKILIGWTVVLVFGLAVAGVMLRGLYADLERRVQQRTAELKKALDALWGEMKLARKIQEALVPKTPTLARCEVAASMRPTDDVGGDYYDVVRAGASEWILIGDVSGHGVPAGLVMMMCHTAVRTVLRSDPDVMPDALLSRVNTVLTENIKLLGEDKYMTMSALRRDPGGTVRVAGAHQDIHVYRAATNCVEAIETTGLWLGLADHIDASLKIQEFELQAGDVCVLHTDGIIEAAKNGQLFDTAGLREVIGHAQGKSAKQVMDDVFAALDGYVLADDATLVVVRQLAS
jgi:serine phosphatase RsbU (regulator of sigma subunit)